MHHPILPHTTSLHDPSHPTPQHITLQPHPNTHHHSPTYMYTPHSISMIEIEKQQNNNLVSSFQDFWGYKCFKGFFLERKTCTVYIESFILQRELWGSDRTEREKRFKKHMHAAVIIFIHWSSNLMEKVEKLAHKRSWRASPSPVFVKSFNVSKKKRVTRDTLCNWSP